MSSTFVLAGTYQAMPSYGMASGDPLITAPIDERLTLALELASQVVLAPGEALSLPFGGLSSAAVVVLKVTGGAIKAVLTSAVGVAQAVPVDTFALLMSSTQPFIDVNVENESGALGPVNVKFFLGQRAE